MGLSGSLGWGMLETSPPIGEPPHWRASGARAVGLRRRSASHRHFRTGRLSSRSRLSSSADVSIRALPFPACIAFAQPQRIAYFAPERQSTPALLQRAPLVCRCVPGRSARTAAAATAPSTSVSDCRMPRARLWACRRGLERGASSGSVGRVGNGPGRHDGAECGTWTGRASLALREVCQVCQVRGLAGLECWYDVRYGCATARRLATDSRGWQGPVQATSARLTAARLGRLRIAASDAPAREPRLRADRVEQSSQQLVRSSDSA